MVLFNYSTRELTAKIVYYGPGLCGKTTNLQYIHGTLPDNVRGKMLSLATKTDRTLFFDFLPIDLGQIRGMKTRVQLYTVPGQVFYNETRKLVLKGADGIVFVADSQATMLGANIESFKNLEENLKTHGMILAEMPHVLQFNKRDLPKLASIEELNAAISRFNAPFYESVATTGIGVQDTLKAITKLVLLHLTRKYDRKTTAPAASTRPTSVSMTGAPPLEPEAPAAPTPSPSQTMQMPAVGATPDFGGAGAIPLSTDSAVPGTEMQPPSAGGVTPHDHDLSVPSAVDPLVLDDLPSSPAPPEPTFGDQEIQALVDEVHETSTTEEGVGSFEPTTPEVAAWEAPVADVDQPTGSEGLSFDAPAAEPAPVIDAAPQPADNPSFEIDHGVDPDWGASGEAPAPPAAPADGSETLSIETQQAWDLGSIEEPQSQEQPSVPPAPPLAPENPPALDLPTLTEVVSDDELFDGSGLDVARLAEGEEREIVVPLEIEQADRSLRRFKLSIRLRMEAAD
jgi:signal recognition particle receptor subunit beta